ncbi:MAG TPA: MlaD family protein [Solirubrobacteraceae bacterium]|nr:MlaD family protein [Solirubrobacteraceae bacterium]
MRRAAVIVAALAGAAIVLIATNPFAGSGYRIDAIFDTADGVSTGMNVEVAGVPVGSVVGVRLTGDVKARLELRVKSRYGPFHTDASCQILPEGIISENYVQCDPGTPGTPTLSGTGSTPPTVPVSHDTTPVSMQQFIDIFSLPTADRLQVLLNELGIATAGRGDSINAILQRANPAIAQADRVLQTVDAQRAELSDAISQTSGVVAQLAARPDAVRTFVDRAARVSAVSAAHRDPLGTALNRLPAFLTQVRAAASSLDTVSRAGTPLLSALRVGGPALSALTATVPQFTAAATPAVRQLTALATSGRVALTESRPVLAQLRRFASGAGPASALLQQLLVNLQQRGGIEYLLDFFYVLATAPAPYDAISHTLALNAVVTQCVTDPLAPGCNRGWTSTQSREAAAERVPAARPAHVRTTRRAPRARPAPTGAPHAGSAPRATPAMGGHATPSTTATTTPATPAPTIPSGIAKTLVGLLNFLVK